MGRFWPLLGLSWLLLGRSWLLLAALGLLLALSWPLLAALGPLLAALGPLLAALSPLLGAQKRIKKRSKIDPRKKHSKNRSWTPFLAHPRLPRAPRSRTAHISNCENEKRPFSLSGPGRVKTLIFGKMCTAPPPEAIKSLHAIHEGYGFPPNPLS